VAVGSRVKPPKFRDLRVRPKLIVLHNVFFLILACAVYYSVIPLVEEYVATSRQQEAALLGAVFLAQRTDLPSAGIVPEDRVFGSAEQIGVPEAVRAWLEEHPEETRLDPAYPGFLYRWDAASGQYGRLRFDD
jgi:hypothetical protein